MKLIYVILFFLIASCGGPASDDSGTQNFNATDTIKEFEMNENRLSAVDFNNELTLMQERILDLVYTLFQSDSSNIDLNLENTLFELDINFSRLEAIDVPDQGDEYLRNMKVLIDWYKTELQENFARIAIPLIKKSKLTEKDKVALEKYDLTFANQEKNLFDSVFVAQEEFAKANNIKLEE